MSFDDVRNRIKRHEGCRLSPYEDSLGVLTVGYGRNLRDVPFTQAEVEFMFLTDFDRAVNSAGKLPGYDSLSDTRRGVLIEMCFQMGLSKVKKFEKFLAAMSRSDWKSAHDEMLDSEWAKQTPERAKLLAEMMLLG